MLEASHIFRLVSAALLSAFVFGAYPTKVRAQDLTRLGGDLTSDLPGRHAIQVTAPNVSDEVRRDKQLDGFPLFHRRVTQAEGLGPTFINRSCGGCHIDNGRGPAKFTTSTFGAGSTMIVKVSLKGALNADGTPRPVPGIGLQLNDHATTRSRLPRVSLEWKPVRTKYPDGTAVSLRTPNLTFTIKNSSVRRIASSLRMSPALIGMGLLEAIPEETILSFSDPDDADGDGISGRPNYVTDVTTGARALGRFGFKAVHPSLAQQTGAAAFFDIGVTNPLFKEPTAVPEISDADFDRLIVYQAIAGVPPARNQEAVATGRALFTTIGCETCHRTNIVTSPDAAPDLANQTIHPFTDLLLHDMGPALADRRPEFSASGSEWRTTPLWGLGYSSGFISNVAPLYLHDGRARTIEEAILWHGGEAANARDRFKAMARAERLELLAFLSSL